MSVSVSENVKGFCECEYECDWMRMQMCVWVWMWTCEWVRMQRYRYPTVRSVPWILGHVVWFCFSTCFVRKENMSASCLALACKQLKPLISKVSAKPATLQYTRAYRTELGVAEWSSIWQSTVASLEWVRMWRVNVWVWMWMWEEEVGCLCVSFAIDWCTLPLTQNQWHWPQLSHDSYSIKYAVYLINGW